MILALVTPDSAHPVNGNAYGHDTKDVTVVSDPAPSSDPAAVDPAAGGGSNTDCGAYCPSGVGLPSGNGNGGGNSTGQPCAGCVGNADGKNPPGQFKDGSDHNNGYECDGNNGIAKTNPAHTGCSPTTTAPSTTTTSVPGATTTTVPG